ncbi:hypothetical protein IAG41_18115 [Sphingomonas sp. JC676]|uniref:hypothetical protein n=1 Tax=Sphingomonas sp. JC676 TaxID=2768065 RepID=UPI001657B6E8|nr:hypothetical protein [Sphingomonas sp. JC676]MBC9034308.1 hypothetical protein [Sphingomonas sp. JC676]
MTAFLVRIALFALVAIVALGPDVMALFAGGPQSALIRAGLLAGGLAGIVASGGWVERLVKHKPVEKPE